MHTFSGISSNISLILTLADEVWMLANHEVVFSLRALVYSVTSFFHTWVDHDAIVNTVLLYLEL